MAFMTEHPTWAFADLGAPFERPGGNWQSWTVGLIAVHNNT
jgi:hypothetical protein